MSKDGEEGRCVKYEDNIDVGVIGVEGFLVGILRWELKDSMEDEIIGDSNKNYIWYDSYERYRKFILDVDGDISRGKSSDIYMFIVCVWDDMCFVEG